MLCERETHTSLKNLIVMRFGSIQNPIRYYYLHPQPFPCHPQHNSTNTILYTMKNSIKGGCVWVLCMHEFPTYMSSDRASSRTHWVMGWVYAHRPNNRYSTHPCSHVLIAISEEDGGEVRACVCSCVSDRVPRAQLSYTRA